MTHAHDKMEGVTPSDENQDMLRPTKILADVTGIIGSAVASGTYILGSGTAPSTTLLGTPVRISASDPLFALATRTPMVRLVHELDVNATAPAAGFFPGLFPVTALAGAAGAVSATLGASSISTALAAINAPAAGSSQQAVSPFLALPPDGLYVLGVFVSATTATNSSEMVRLRLELDWQ